MDPSSHTFDYKDLAVSVATNNKTGYQLTMSTASTSLINTADNTLTIPTLDALSGGYTTATFQTNKWGYSKDSGNYFPFPASELLLQNTTATNGDNTDLRFATKIDYTQPSGTYKTTISFNAVTNPLVDYMQDFTKAMCEEKASDADYIVVDKRDNNEYTVRYINGNCWMTQNLRFGRDNTNPATAIIELTSNNSDVIQNRNITVYDLIAYGNSNCNGNYNTSGTGTGAGYSTPCIHSSTNDNFGVWYNYATATAGSIISSTTTEANESICPSNWTLPSYLQLQNYYSQINLLNPVLGGYYHNGSNNYPTTYGFWWSSTPHNGQDRYYMRYDGGILNNGSRIFGFYVRCILR